MNNDCIAIILARGGSKRLPRKNILEFNSKPLIAWTIEAALDSKIFNKVLVSTDDYEISKISKDYGAEVPFLRLDAADDFSDASKATIFALNQAEKYWNKEFTYVAQLMANCPLRDKDNIKNLHSTFLKSKAPSQISCFKYGWMNPWWAFKLNNDGGYENVFPEALKNRSQDLPDLFCPTGAFWIANREALTKNKSFYMSGLRYEKLNWISAIDIDDKDDFEMADILFKLKNKI